MQPRNIQELARRPVRFGRIGDDVTLETHDSRDPFGQLADAQIRTHADIDEILAGITLHQEHRRIGQIVHIQKLPPRRPRTPDHDLLVAALLRLVKLADQRR